ncbi:GNAT family N-acetyltransferase [Apilactobacillus ozensis]|uniref:GNAT family N-acetyltransferase n=1 Tax=Apilactobacillus ozensis TaxID=866801 RepID=UPI002009EA4E|nr:GNAT family N-acetyltransferase [Apilactobacillus ozensis]MCK8607752.1 GNAT family N-acetyltransferase [Apilactobacillus ozensis]
MSDVSNTLAKPNDAKNLIKLLKQLTKESDTFTVDRSLGQISEQDEARQIMLINQTRNNIILVAKLEDTTHDVDELIGVVTIQQIGDTKCGELGVAVLKDYWNQGVGSALVEESIDWGCDYSNLENFYLVVKKDNLAAIHLYEKIGFKKSKNRFIKMDTNLKSTYEMNYQLKK